MVVTIVVGDAPFHPMSNNFPISFTIELTQLAIVKRQRTTLLSQLAAFYDEFSVLSSN